MCDICTTPEMEIKSAASWYISDIALQSVVYISDIPWHVVVVSIYGVTSHVTCNMIPKP